MLGNRVRHPTNRALGSTSRGVKGDRDVIEKMIIYEDLHVLVLNKPFVHCRAGQWTQCARAMTDRFDGERPASCTALIADARASCLSRSRAKRQPSLGARSRRARRKKRTGHSLKGMPEPPQGKIEAALVKASGPDGDRVRKATAGEQDKAMHTTTHYSRPSTMLAQTEARHGHEHQLRAHIHDRPPDRPATTYEGDVSITKNMEMKLHLHARTGHSAWNCTRVRRST